MLLAITYPMKIKRLKVAKWGAPKKNLKKNSIQKNIGRFSSEEI